MSGTWRSPRASRSTSRRRRSPWTNRWWRSARRWGSTRCSSSSAAGRTTHWWRRSRPERRFPTASGRSARSPTVQASRLTERRTKASRAGPTSENAKTARCQGTRAVSAELGLAGDLARLQAAGAHVQALRGTVDRGADALDVRVETALGDLARPRAVVAEAGLLGADVADGSHRALLGFACVERRWNKLW